jgi:hypothetical protein
MERNESLRTYLSRKLESVPVGAVPPSNAACIFPRPCTERRELTNQHWKLNHNQKSNPGQATVRSVSQGQAHGQGDTPLRPQLPRSDNPRWDLGDKPARFGCGMDLCQMGDVVPHDRQPWASHEGAPETRAEIGISSRSILLAGPQM